ncbi:glycoside hydrolase family 3 C-terminal domain-containing protein [Microbacterium sp. MPKO10]|uniref:glycoside hydrolase family 3 C-terminal domain-containing protein n=1 Tax=Microbacterium sp. MPKO10 TaxID=2989818 RepID=UPI0022355157|nr:glycoside hydrolase family 3 C-terminal domain-containing protein [Microbacterium sp. MPKO10]MCW4459175.1 glycoside hydrolase family 3 C-terminal domain-containing protein [Microbacterium sp. MPKO10]
MTAEFTTRSAADVVAGLSIEQKAALTSGENFWETKAVGDVPSIMLTDGPHGVRKQTTGADHLGIGDSVPATCFPPAVALGATFDPQLLERVGIALGEEARAENVGVLLGPGINIKRSPLCGRNFEYLSEDPFVSGELGAALVRGLQSQGVGASLKHFAANNQEHDRLRVSSDVDERPLREIYLRGFERVVTAEQPWTVMCSYNRINGVYASENHWLLTEVLRDDWGFEGLVVSDWGAVNVRTHGLAAGLDLEMPATGGRSDAEIVAAVHAGDLDEAVLDVAAERIVSIVQKAVANARDDASYDSSAHHALAREVAGRGIVLLKNDNDLLPLPSAASLAVIGEFARTPRYQGAGSSLINPTQVDDALSSIRARHDNPDAVTFAPGFTLDGSEGAGLADEAVAAAAVADVAVIFAGLPAAEESEGFDREHIDLPAAQLELIDRVVAANSNTVVVLSNGGVVRLPFAPAVPAILEGWLLGQAGGSATADVLFGDVNPSGRLAETIPVRMQDTPAYLDFPGERGHVRYGEGIFVGYRWYDARETDVAFPFGHGLSYTTFAYADFAVTADAAGLTARVRVTNSGERAGREVVQLYIGLPESTVQRAPRELKGFAAVDLAAGESREVEIVVPREDLAYWDVRAHRFVVEGGEYAVSVGASSRDLRSNATAAVEGDEVLVPLNGESSIGELSADPVAGPMIQQAMSELMGTEAAAIASQDSIHKMMASFPIGRVANFGVGVDPESVQQLLDAANAQRQTPNA